jgi:hypothetical protein
MPKITIRAEGDEASGLVEPFRHAYAVSTDAGLAEPDEVVQQLASAPPPDFSQVPQSSRGVS